jgi:hypothetical protein
MPGIGGYRRIGHGVGNAEVHRCKAGRRRVPQISDLHGRGAAREHRQPAGRRVPREVDEDVDPIGADQLDHRIVGQLPDIAPLVRGRAQPLSHRVLSVKIAVQDIGECAAVAGAQDGFKEMRNGVRPKIARNETNAQSLRGTGVGTNGGRRRRRVFPGEARSPLADDRDDLFGTDPIRTMQRQDVAGLSLEVGRIQAAGRAQLLDSRIDVAARELVESQVVADHMIVRLKIARVLVMSDGPIEFPQLAGDVTQHEPGYIGTWLE